jgi:uncharacterized membrane protein
MVFLGLLGLLGLVLLLVPVLSFVRTLQLGRDLNELRRRTELIERRLHDVGPLPQRATRAEAVMPPSPLPQSPSVTIPATTPIVPRVPDWAREPEREPAFVAADAPRAHRFDLEERIGGRWLQHAGLIVLLLGIAFFLRYAFEREWLSPTVRVALGIFAGIAMAAGGVRLAARYRGYGLLLAGGGIVALYLSLYAALNLYGLFDAQVVFGALVLVTITAAVLADRTDSQAIALMAVCGGFATPFLVGGKTDQQISLFSYTALLIGATMYLAHRRRWRWLNVASLTLTVVTVAAWGDTYYTDAKYLRTELFLTLYCAMFVDVLRRSWSRLPPASALGASAGRDDTPFVMSLMMAPVAYHTCSVVILAPHGLAFLIYLIAFTAITVMLSDYHDSTLMRSAAFIAMALPLGAWIQAHHWRDWLLTSTLAILGIYAIHLAAQIRAAVRDEEFDDREVALIHANGVGVYVALYQVLTDTLSIGQLAGVGVLLALLNAGIWFMVRRLMSRRALHWMGVAFTLIAAAVWLQFGGPWAVTIWATEGAVVFWAALKTERRWLRAGAWILFTLAAFRWAQHDIQMTTTAYKVLLNARAVTGLYLVGLLYFSAWMTVRYPGASSDRYQERAILIVAASAATAIVISTEIISFWQLRAETVDAYVAREMMLSASWVLYAASLVVLGMRKKYAPIRYFAIVLFGIALLKVFLIDLETLGGVYRIAGFVVVGLILLVVSFLYQRNALDRKKPV